MPTKTKRTRTRTRTTLRRPSWLDDDDYEEPEPIDAQRLHDMQMHEGWTEEDLIAAGLLKPEPEPPPWRRSRTRSDVRFPWRLPM